MQNRVASSQRRAQDAPAGTREALGHLGAGADQAPGDLLEAQRSARGPKVWMGWKWGGNGVEGEGEGVGEVGGPTVAQKDPLSANIPFQWMVLRVSAFWV